MASTGDSSGGDAGAEQPDAVPARPVTAQPMTGDKSPDTGNRSAARLGENREAAHPATENQSSAVPAIEAHGPTRPATAHKDASAPPIGQGGTAPGDRPRTAMEHDTLSGAVTTDRAARRTRVVLGEAATRRRPADPARADLAEQTPVGEALVKGLVRAQLALALRLSLVVATGLGALPLLFAVAPEVARIDVLGVKLPWLLLGALSFPFLFGVGWAYVRWAERNEQDFTAVIRRPE